jgi:propanol-preferring alcohol dehydrogenase
MRGLKVKGGRSVELADLPTPEARDGWVVIRSSMSAVCGSDLHNFRSDPDKLGSRADRVAGHEAVGTVEQAGRGSGVEAGTRVVVYQHFGEGRCTYCRTGRPMFCPERQTLGNHVDGADAEYVTAPGAICLPLPDSLSDEVGALLACNFGTAFSGVRKLGLDGADVVVVFGLGPVGCCATIVAAADGATVVAVDPVQSRRKLAESLGAARTVDPASEDLSAVVAELTAGRGAEASVDTSGNPRAQTDAFNVVRAGGRMLVLAATAPWTMDPSQLWRRGLTIMGSWVYELGEYEHVVRMAEAHADELGRLVTRHVPGSRAEEAFAAADKASEGKVVIDWSS